MNNSPGYTLLPLQQLHAKQTSCTLSILMDGSSMYERGNRRPGNIILIVMGIVLALALLAAGSYFLYYQNQPKSDVATTKNSQSKNTASSSTKPSTHSADTAAYLEITQWGVRAPYSGPLKLQYAISGHIASFTSAELVSANPGCNNFGGSIIRSGPNDSVDAAGDTAADFYAKNKDSPSVTITKLGDYYYLFAHDQSLCSALNLPEDSAAAAIQQQANDAVKSVVQKLQEVSN